MSSWESDAVADRDAVLRLEFPRQVADPYLEANPGVTHLDYGCLLHALSRD